MNNAGLLPSRRWKISSWKFDQTLATRTNLFFANPGSCQHMVKVAGDQPWQHHAERIPFVWWPVCNEQARWSLDQVWRRIWASRDSSQRQAGPVVRYEPANMILRSAIGYGVWRYGLSRICRFVAYLVRGRRLVHHRASLTTVWLHASKCGLACLRLRVFVNLSTLILRYRRHASSPFFDRVWSGERLQAEGTGRNRGLRMICRRGGTFCRP